MAKRRKDVEEEETPFKIPKFDEESFLKRERRNIKVTIYSFLFGILMAFICFVFWALMGPGNSVRWPLVLLVAIVDGIFLRNIFHWRDIDLSDFTKYKWLTTYLTYFFTWLIVFIVIVNPPIYDEESPNVNVVVLPERQEFGGAVQIVAKITDNAGVEKSGITLTVDNLAIDQNEYYFENSTFRYIYRNDTIDTEKTIEFVLSVKDINGRETLYKGNFTYTNDTIKLVSPLAAYNEPGPEVGSADTIKFKVTTPITRLYYTIDDGEPINVTEREAEYYITYPKYKGWPRNKNVTMRVYAEKSYLFDLVTDITDENLIKEQIKAYRENSTFSNTILDTQVYYFRTASDPEIGTIDPPECEELPVNVVKVPGFELIIFVLALIAVILISKKRNRS